jgi:hypothetical protein
MTPATPLQYLRRWVLHNRLFFDNVELVGLRIEGCYHRIVITQRDWGDHIVDWEEIDQAMHADYGLKRLPISQQLGGYEARAYCHGRFAVFDVRPVNCVRSAEGIIVPFDVIPQIFSHRNAARLRYSDGLTG